MSIEKYIWDFVWPDEQAEEINGVRQPDRIEVLRDLMPKKGQTPMAMINIALAGGMDAAVELASRIVDELNSGQKVMQVAPLVVMQSAAGQLIASDDPAE